MASPQEYVLVSTDAVRVEWFTRESDETWVMRVAEGLDGVVRLERLGVPLRLEPIYQGVDVGG